MRKDTVERKARLLINSAGVNRFPVPVDQIADYLGVQIKYEELRDDISGVLEKSTTGPSTILVNKKHGEERQRFTIAHELGHYSLSDRTGIIIDRAIYFRDSKSQLAVDDDEIAANTFAAELLMPASEVKRITNQHITDGKLNPAIDLVQHLAETFKVSTTAMSIRLQNLNYNFLLA